MIPVIPQTQTSTSRKQLLANFSTAMFRVLITVYIAKCWFLGIFVVYLQFEILSYLLSFYTLPKQAIIKPLFNVRKI